MPDDGLSVTYSPNFPKHGTAYEGTDFAGNLQRGDWVYSGTGDSPNIHWDHVMMVVDVDKSGNIWLGDLYNHRFLYDPDNKQATRTDGELGPVNHFIGIHMPYEELFQ